MAFGGPKYGISSIIAGKTGLANGSPATKTGGVVKPPVKAKPKGPVAQANPWLNDPAYIATELSNKRNLQLGNASALYQAGQIGQETGYNAQGARDYSDPYSQANLLEETFKRNKAGTLGSYANQGQLYSGALGVAQNENARNYSIDSDRLQRSAANSYGNLALNKAQGIANYGSGTDTAAFDSLLRSLGLVK